MKHLSVKKHGRAIIVKYYDLVDAWSIGPAFARRLIKSVHDLEAMADKYITEKALAFTKEDVVAYWFASLDSISTGIDMRSNTKFAEIGDKFITRYHELYNENKQFCLDIHTFIETSDETESYLKDWKRYDKCNQLNYKFKFGFPQITMESFKRDELKNMLQLTGEILDI